MEGFAIDLDKVLDDFEQSEDGRASSEPSYGFNSAKHDSDALQRNDPEYNIIPKPFDINDANFGPAPINTPQLDITDGNSSHFNASSHYIGASCSQLTTSSGSEHGHSHVVVNDEYYADDQEGSASHSASKLEQPEILHSATDLSCDAGISAHGTGMSEPMRLNILSQPDVVPISKHSMNEAAINESQEPDSTAASHLDTVTLLSEKVSNKDDANGVHESDCHAKLFETPQTINLQTQSPTLKESSGDNDNLDSTREPNKLTCQDEKHSIGSTIEKTNGNSNFNIDKTINNTGEAHLPFEEQLDGKVRASKIGSVAFNVDAQVHCDKGLSSSEDDTSLNFENNSEIKTGLVDASEKPVICKEERTEEANNIVSFGDEGIVVDENDMEAYLKDVDNDMVDSRLDDVMCKNEMSFHQEMQDTSRQSCNSDNSVIDSPAAGNGERRGSIGSVERFLAPPILSPGITTPKDDPGFSKVPGFQPQIKMPSLAELGTPEEIEKPIISELSNLQAVSNTAVEMKSQASHPSPQLGIGARPKEPLPGKKTRPNTLLGLSTPNTPTLPHIPNSSVLLSSSGNTNGHGVSETIANMDDFTSPARKKQSHIGMISPSDEACIAMQKEESLVDTFTAQQTNNTCAPKNLQNNEGSAAQPFRFSNSSSTQQSFAPAKPPQSLNLNFTITVDNNRKSALPNLQSAPNDQILTSPSSIGLNPPPNVTIGPELMPDPVTEVVPTNIQASEDTVDGNLGQQGERPKTLDINPAPIISNPASAPSSTINSSCRDDISREGEGDSDNGYTLESGPGALSPPLGASGADVIVTEVGKIAPVWIPDADSLNCMECEAKFTFTKRRHHCRACGKIFCSSCCYLKCKLQYMENKEARVCSKCYQDIVRAQSYERMQSNQWPSQGAGMPTSPDESSLLEMGHDPHDQSPNPNNPSEYCSTVSPLLQARANAPQLSVLVPTGVLRKQGSQRGREPKNVMFSDGIRPGGDLTELDGSDLPRQPPRRSRHSKKSEGNASRSVVGGNDQSKNESPKKQRKHKKNGPAGHNHERFDGSSCLIPPTGLPPVIISDDGKDIVMDENPVQEELLQILKKGGDQARVLFAVNKNLFVLVKIVTLECCVNRVCWCFTTRGMCTVGQDEVVIVMECLPDEDIPRDIFSHFSTVYEEAGKGNTVSHLGHTIFGQSFLDSKDHCGFLYIRPSFQCLQNLILPDAPYVFGILLQRWETPWAKVFPLRLMLRLGAEFRYYPCPLVSVRFRKPVFAEIGHTIMNLLADFRNFKYMLPQIKGVTIHMEEKKTFINFPKNRYNEVMKMISNSNDHVMALAANFSTEADSHLVCIQNEEGNYQTQAINILNKPRKTTGASFVVFNGALKSASGLRAKSSIVEDGLMVQITNESMVAVKQALHDMKDYVIGCGSLDLPEPEEQVMLSWVEDDKQVNMGVRSPIDGMEMDGIESVHIHSADEPGIEIGSVRWTEVFFISNGEDTESSPRCEPVDLSRLAETLAHACSLALSVFVNPLKEANLTKIGLRVTIDSDKVGYECGAQGEKLPDLYMNELDNELIPVIHNAASQNQEGPVILELIFHVVN